MAAVAFALDGRPGLSQSQAEDLARLHALGRNLAAIELAGRIRTQAALDPDNPPAGEDLELSPLHLKEIAQVFIDGPDLLGEPAFERLNHAVLEALGSA